MTTTTAERASHPLTPSLRAIEAGCRPSAEWSAITNGEHRGYVGYEAELRVAHADIEWGGILLAGAVEPLRSIPGYLWIVADPTETTALVHGIAPTLAGAKAAVEAAAANLALTMLTEGVSA